jgi:hypothetical protein
MYDVTYIRKCVDESDSKSPVVSRCLASAAGYINTRPDIGEDQLDEAIDEWLSTPLSLPADRDAVGEFHRIKNLRDLAALEFRLANYTQAELYLQDVRTQSGQKYERYAWKDETAEMLAVSYSRQGKWVEAERMIEEGLADSHRDGQRLKLLHILAEIFLNKGDLESSENAGLEAVNVSNMLVKTHPLSYQSMYIMCRISCALDDEPKLCSWSKQLPEGYWTPECEEIEKLFVMARDEAADNVTVGMLKNFLTDDKGAELESVIAAGGVTGTGGYSLIHALAEYGEAAPLRVLLERGVDPDARDGEENKAIHFATAHDNAEQLLDMLVSYGSDIDSRNGRKETALIIAVKNGRADIVAWLIKHGADIEAKDIYSNNALHHSAYQERADIARILLPYVVNIDDRTSHGRTALHTAALRGHNSVVRALKVAGANLTLRDHLGKSAFDLAREEGHEETVGILKGVQPKKVEEKAEPEPEAVKLRKKPHSKKALLSTVQIRR